METKKTEISCILLNKEDELFLAIIDEEAGYVELRKNDKKPFGYPLENIEPGYIFVVTTEVKPNTMICTIEPAEIFRYTDILKNKKLMDYINSNEIALVDLHKRVEELRDNKIEKIIDGKV